MPARTLDQRVRDAIIPEPIIFEVDAKGEWHLATDHFPPRSLIDIQLLPHLPFVRVDQKKSTVTVAVDGRTAVYRRRGHGFNRAVWICDLENQ